MEIKSLYQTGPVGKQLCALHFNKMFWHQQKAPLTEPAPLPLLAHLSGRLDERCRAPTRRAALNSFQQDSGCGDVAPWHAEARLRFPTAASRYMIGHLRAQTASRFSVLWLITPLKQIKPAQHMKGRLKLLWKIKHSSKLGWLHAFFSFFFLHQRWKWGLHSEQETSRTESSLPEQQHWSPSPSSSELQPLVS